MDRLELRMNAGADEIAIVKVIFRLPEYLKAHIVQLQGEASDFRGFVCIYNILTRTHQCIKG